MSASRCLALGLLGARRADDKGGAVGEIGPDRMEGTSLLGEECDGGGHSWVQQTLALWFKE